ncbi:MAG: nicotinate-nucleotide--dimethylbenzimidazole phosphoribosyltransferase [Gammaproteobacteria bacterium]|uniref:Nicotinate-nucleotide--dimethylbenzimidazole phosphoribosyltransferase n=1 Tax=Candidatus Thiopontia autotrophica TaxID=2841688 RepID=A0A8J6P960_9GAMM|nr:nicotinate-nucleotide--dimethylbenzimidazole phosphoribosyltransferase [Candidatus Thiopontia autotrophica]MBL6968980.1 nicotinate-nucleotide--dimethylbenzimidazole phosphoribosyltransferase [Gammaproteobacteria bacterium]
MGNNWWESPVQQVDRQSEKQAEERQLQLTKPPGALGRLESLAIRLASMQGRVKPAIKNPFITIFAADHGVAEMGVSAFPQEVTAEMVRNFSRGGAAISVLANSLGATLEVVNVGTVGSLEPLGGVVDARISSGTKNLAQAPAMDRGELERALGVGREAVERAAGQGADIYIGGEMGIANTTSASAVAAALLGERGASVVGAGTGLDSAGVSRKGEVIEQALELHKDNLGSPMDILQNLGGFEVAALAGAYIKASQSGVPVLVDGFITSVAALAAVRINSAVRGWLIFSHRSAEQGHGKVLDAMDANPLLDLGMRLGEGSGAAVAVPILQQACQLHGEMATFGEAGVSEG